MRVLAQRPGGWQLGHAVLASKGMVAWIGAWTTLAPAPAAGTSAPDPAARTNLPGSTTTSTPSPATISEHQQQRIHALTHDLPALWHDPSTPMRERKRLIRLLVTDITLIRSSEHITAHVRLPGGQQHTLTVPRPRTAAELHTTPDQTLALIDELMAEHTFDEAVTVLNEQNVLTGWGKPYKVASLRALCRTRHIPSLRDRLQTAGMLTLAQIAHDLGAAPTTIKIWQRLGLITGRRINGRVNTSTTPASAAHPETRAGTQPYAARRNCQTRQQQSTQHDQAAATRLVAAHPRQKVQYEAHALEWPVRIAASIAGHQVSTVVARR